MLTIALLAILVSVVAVLAIPIDIGFTVQGEDGFRSRFTVGWLFGAVRGSLDSARGEAQPEHHAPSSRPRSAKRGRRRRVNPGAMLRSRGFLDRCLRLLRGLIGRIRIRRLRLALNLGLDDPADTGQLWGAIGSWTWAVRLPDRVDLAITPDFSGARLAIAGEGEIRIVPLLVLASLTRFMLSPITWRALRALRSGG